MAGQEIGSLYYDLTIDDKRLKGQLDNADRSVKTFGDRIGQHWDNAVGASQMFARGLTVAGVAVAAFGALSVKSFMDSEKVMAQTNATLKSTGGVAGVTAEQVTSLASAFQKSTMFSDEMVQEGENLLLTFTKIGKDIFPQATEVMLDMSQALGQDVKSSAIQLGKALQDPILGVTALRRVGVNFSEAQQDVIKNLVETGRAGEAQALILKELQTEFGGSAKAAGQTFAGQLKILRNSFDDVMEGIGGFLAKALTPLVAKFQEWVNSLGGAEAIAAKLKATLIGLKDDMPVITGAIVGGLVPALVNLIQRFGIVALYIAAFVAVGAALGFAVKTIVEHFGGLDAVMLRLQPVFTVMSNIWSNNIYPALMLLWAAIQMQLLPALRELWATIEPILIPNLKALAVAMAVIVVAAIIAVIAILTILVNVLTVVANVINFLVSVARNGFNIIANIVAGTMAMVVALINGNVNQAVNIFATMGGRIGNSIGNITGAITGPFQRAFDWIKKGVDEVVKSLGKLNPFMRHSPSLVDMVTRGTKAISSQYGKMFNDLSSMAIQSKVDLIGGVAPGADNRNYSNNIEQVVVNTPAEDSAMVGWLDRNTQLTGMGVTPQ